MGISTWRCPNNKRMHKHMYHCMESGRGGGAPGGVVYLEDCAQEVVHKVVTLGSTRALPSHSCMEKDRYCPNLHNVHRVHNARGNEGYPAAHQVLFYFNLIS